MATRQPAGRVPPMSINHAWRRDAHRYELEAELGPRRHDRAQPARPAPARGCPRDGPGRRPARHGRPPHRRRRARPRSAAWATPGRVCHQLRLVQRPGESLPRPQRERLRPVDPAQQPVNVTGSEPTQPNHANWSSACRRSRQADTPHPHGTMRSYEVARSQGIRPERIPQSTNITSVALPSLGAFLTERRDC
jgi:hypothetical protein